MQIPRYWAKGNLQVTGVKGDALLATCWRWSDLSVEDAQRQADERAIELSRKLEAGTPLGQYGYGQQPLREEIIQVVAKDAQADIAVVTRNAYGVLVLNASKAMFIDIDFTAHAAAHPVGGLFRRLLGKQTSAGQEESALQKIQDCVTQHPDLGMRVYRTCAGMRCLVTSRTFDVEKPETMELLKAIGSDPLYIRLCQAQHCFRARLTPKPWRCDLGLPPARYPWADQEAESDFRQWLTIYEHSIQGYSVCRFLKQLGSSQLHPEIRPILDLHDRFTSGHADRPLA